MHLSHCLIVGVYIYSISVEQRDVFMYKLEAK